MISYYVKEIVFAQNIFVFFSSGEGLWNDTRYCLHQFESYELFYMALAKYVAAKLNPIAIWKMKIAKDE